MSYPLQTPEQLAILLKSFRKKRGYTQKAIAEKLGISQQTYQQIEAKPQNVTLERLFKVLRLLDVRVDLLDEMGSASKLVSDQGSEQW
ncbi:helix-turn-helix transcriptional regulator [Pleionea sediminis]|uniref:helix-turn-helix transcriptional regulator n=1 Tax=Pleionea sediminis TaxID=2569479 RepID=UPI001186D98B|nr:helix-turn-helix transcriptional regulator [Pleionea sediminis]